MCYTNRQYDRRCRELLDLIQLRDDIQKQIDTRTNDLKTDMGDIEEVVTDNYRIKYENVVSNRFDTTAFKAADEKRYKQYLKQSVSRRFTVKAVR